MYVYSARNFFNDCPGKSCMILTDLARHLTSRAPLLCMCECGVFVYPVPSLVSHGLEGKEEVSNYCQIYSEHPLAQNNTNNSMGSCVIP